MFCDRLFAAKEKPRFSLRYSVHTIKIPFMFKTFGKGFIRKIKLYYHKIWSNLFYKGCIKTLHLRDKHNAQRRRSGNKAKRYTPQRSILTVTKWFGIERSIRLVKCCFILEEQTSIRTPRKNVSIFKTRHSVILLNMVCVFFYNFVYYKDCWPLLHFIRHSSNVPLSLAIIFSLIYYIEIPRFCYIFYRLK